MRAPLRLAASFVPRSYRARLAIDPARVTFDGSIAIAAALEQPADTLSLHGRQLTIHGARAIRDGAAAAPVPLALASRGEDVLELRPGSPLAPGAWTLELDYTGELDEHETAGAFVQRVAGASYVFTQFEAIYARRVFPCVDEPGHKVPWQLTLDVPAGVTAVSNTPLQSTTPLASGGARLEFAPSQPLPSYLVAFGVGPFDVSPGPATRSGIPVRMVTLAGRASDAAYSLATTAPLVDQLEDWFGIPYPYDKLDLLTIPLTLGFSAMENAGLITFSEELSLFEQATASWEKRHTWILVAAHELAHQWFGNYVTMAWWDDLWLNEGLSTWMETKIASRFEPAWHDELADRDTLQRALQADRVTSARRIREPIRSADDISSVFDAITYDKGASILNMFESYVGAERFRQGVRQYLEARAFGNATSSDFVTAIGDAVGRDLASAFASFLEQPGAPELMSELDCSLAPPRLELSQRPFVAAGSGTRPSGARWTFPVCSVYDRDGERAEVCTLFEGDSAVLPLPASRCPRWVMPNAGGRGYYRYGYAADHVAAMRDLAWPALTWSERRAVFFDVTQALPRIEARPRAGRSSAGAARRGPSRGGLALALSLVGGMLAGGNRFTVHDAVEFATDLDRFIPGSLRPQYERWLRRTFSGDALRLGLLPRSDDDLDAEVARGRLVEAAAWFGREPAVVQRAVELGPRWRDLPQAVRGTILKLAVDADAALAAALESSVRSEPDRARRGEMIAALGAQRDPERVARALRLLFDPAFDFREALALLSDPSSAQTRRRMQSFFRAHRRELMRRLPRDDTSGIARVVHLFTETCQAGERRRVVRDSSELFAPLPGGKTIVQQSLEAMDQCIATRAELEPQLRSWLAEL